MKQESPAFSWGEEVNQTKTKSRARLRSIPAGYTKQCDACGQCIKFNMKEKPKRVICNVYVGDDWKEVQIFHFWCYLEAGEPYGEAW